jgi:hypothetical protein
MGNGIGEPYSKDLKSAAERYNKEKSRSTYQLKILSK